MNLKKFSNLPKAFSVVELAVIITIISSITAIYLGNYSNVKQSTENYINDYKKMLIIQKAIDSFVIENERLPCPASSNADSSSNALYNVIDNTGPFSENITQFAGSGTFTAINNSTSYENRICLSTYGAIPTAAIGLGNDFQFDEWGRKYYYAVSSKRCGVDGCNRVTLNNDNTYSSDLTVTDKTTTPNIIYNNVAYLILSHGEKGLGAYTKKGVIYSTPNATSQPDEFQNLDTNYDDTYVIANKDALKFTDTILFRTITDLKNQVYKQLDFGFGYSLDDVNQMVPNNYPYPCYNINGTTGGITGILDTDFTQSQILTNVTPIYDKIFNISSLGVSNSEDIYLDVIMNLEELCYKIYNTQVKRSCPRIDTSPNGYTYKAFFGGCTR